MSDEAWFYMDGYRPSGPVTWDRLIGLLRTGKISSRTQIWLRGDMAGRSLDLVLPPGALAPPPLPPEALAGSSRIWPDTAPHPWRRYVARIVDTLVYSTIGFFITGMTLGVIDVALAHRFVDALTGPRGIAINNILGCVFAIPLGALAVGLTSGSLGKWLMGVRVVGADGRPLGILRGLNREILVWVQGLGCGIPVVILITMILGYRTLKRQSRTSWDKEMQLVVLHRPAGPRQTILESSGLILFLLLLVGLSSLAFVE